MKHPNKKIDKFWFNLDQKSSQKSKKGYPFIIRIVKKIQNIQILINALNVIGIIFVSDAYYTLMTII